MSIPDTISAISLVLSILSITLSALTFLMSLRRERKNATLDAFNTLQVQALDELNTYAKARVEEIAKNPGSKEYKELSSLLARLEHFSVGVNTKIYDISVVRRLAGRHLCGLQEKVTPLIQKKREINRTKKHYNEFEMMMKKIRRLYAKKGNSHV